MLFYASRFRLFECSCVHFFSLCFNDDICIVCAKCINNENGIHNLYIMDKLENDSFKCTGLKKQQHRRKKKWRARVLTKPWSKNSLFSFKTNNIINSNQAIQCNMSLYLSLLVLFFLYLFVSYHIWRMNSKTNLCNLDLDQCVGFLFYKYWLMWN